MTIRLHKFTYDIDRLRRSLTFLRSSFVDTAALAELVETQHTIDGSFARAVASMTRQESEDILFRAGYVFAWSSFASLLENCVEDLYGLHPEWLLEALKDIRGIEILR